MIEFKLRKKMRRHDSRKKSQCRLMKSVLLTECCCRPYIYFKQIAWNIKQWALGTLVLRRYIGEILGQLKPKQLAPEF